MGLSAPITHFQGQITFAKIMLVMQKNIEHFLGKGELVIFLLAFMALHYFPNSRPWHNGERFLLILTILLVAFRWLASIGWEESLITSEGVFPDACSRLFLHAGPSLVLLGSSRLFYRPISECSHVK
jgi:hypothetical protein